LKATRPGLSVVAIEPLAYFTLELARPANGWAGLLDLVANARQVSEQMQAEGIPVRFVRSIFVPEDESCFYLYEAASADDVREAARRAALPFEHVAEAVRGRREKSDGRALDLRSEETRRAWSVQRSLQGEDPLTDGRGGPKPSGRSSLPSIEGGSRA
jgi:hypothetical protein